MKNIPTLEAFLNESLNEGDMTNHYDGFVVLDTKTKKLYKFKYVKGTNNVKVEGDAIAKLMTDTKEPRANFMVHGFVKKGEWDKSDAEILESTINESFTDNREIEGSDTDSMLDAISFLSRGMGLIALEKEMKGKFPFAIQGSPMAHPKGRGMFSANISFTKKGSSNTNVNDAIDAMNKVLTDHGYDKFKVKILK